MAKTLVLTEAGHNELQKGAPSKRSIAGRSRNLCALGRNYHEVSQLA